MSRFAIRRSLGQNIRGRDSEIAPTEKGGEGRDTEIARTEYTEYKRVLCGGVNERGVFFFR